MWVVVGPHTIVNSRPPLAVVSPYAVLDKRCVNLTIKVLARLHGNGKRFVFMISPVVIVPLLQHERNPADFVFHNHDF